MWPEGRISECGQREGISECGQREGISECGQREGSVSVARGKDQ